MESTKTAFSVREAIDLAATPRRSGELAKDSPGVRISELRVQSNPHDARSVMKAVHAAGGVHVMRPGFADVGDRFAGALAKVLRKSQPSPAFWAALAVAKGKTKRQAAQ
jgi:hypothetical protein